MEIEILSKRGERCKHFNLGNGKCKFVGFTAPIHYKNKNTKDKWEDIVLDFQEDGKGNLLVDKNTVSCGFRQDKQLSKYFGLRSDENHQFEVTPKSVVLDGVESLVVNEGLAVEKTEEKVITNKINNNIEIINKLSSVSLKNYFKITNRIEDFAITEQIHLKGLTCSNKKDGNKYIADEQGYFNFVDENNEWKFGIRKPFFIDADNKPYYSLQHELKEVNGELLYTKTPTKEGKDDLVLAQFPIMVDADTFYTSTADGYVTSITSSTWSSVYGDTTGALTNNSSTTMAPFCRITKSNYDLQRCFFYFDTSSISDASIVTDAVLSLYHGNYASKNMSVQKGTQSDTLANNDIDNFSGNEYAHITPTANQYNDFTFNATGKSDISLTGTTKLCVRQYNNDYSNSAPTGDEGTMPFWTAEEAESGERRPRLVVTYISGSAIKTVDGLAKASVKTVNGLAIASVKSINGLA